MKTKQKNAFKEMKEYQLHSLVQKIVIYESQTRYYVIGSDEAETRFRVFQIDRTEPFDLVIYHDEVEYTTEEMRDLLIRIKFAASVTKSTIKSSTPSQISTKCALGIVGFVRFFEGYYMILVTTRKRVAQIGPHFIYKILESQLLYIPSDNCKPPAHPDEQRYLKLFLNVDLTSNFYFSYSYELTQTLQHNLSNTKIDASDNLKSNEAIGYILYPESKFIWNEYLLEHSRNALSEEWTINLIHGFVQQECLNVTGKPVYLTLIARRSRKYAGTRFLKRGSNWMGDVANEVEIEQIVNEASLTNFYDGHFTSYVQLRGSVPGFWSQDISNMVPKPAISVDQIDSYAYVSGLHFSSCFKRYGVPLVVVNLIKKREKKPHENQLITVLKDAISYLNQFLKKDDKILYVGCDMARISKNKNVLNVLNQLFERFLNKTGIFWNNSENPHVQTGVIRVNCVDCLDRTNTAQFAVFKCALAKQLHALGIIDETLENNAHVVNILEDMMEDLGDTLAIQYGGSQLVHRIQGYRKNKSGSTAGYRDIMQTISRYYSNTFSDNDKQQAINVFLGIYRPDTLKPNVWDLPTDYYLHNEKIFCTSTYNLEQNYTNWCPKEVIDCLPLPYEQVHKIPKRVFLLSKDDKRIDWFALRYRTNRLTTIQEDFLFRQLANSREFQPRNWPHKRGFLNLKNRTKERIVSEIETSSSGEDDAFDCDFDLDFGKQNHTKKNFFKNKQIMNMPTMFESYGVEVCDSAINYHIYKKYSDMDKFSSGRDPENRYFSLESREIKDIYMEKNIDETVLNSKYIYEKYIQSSKKWKSIEPIEQSKCLYENYVSLGAQ